MSTQSDRAGRTAQAGAAWPRHTSAWHGGTCLDHAELRTIHEYRPTASQTLAGPSAPCRLRSRSNEGRVAKQRTRGHCSLARGRFAVLLTAVIVHGSGPPFTYRIGQRPDRELRVNVKEFRLRNQTKTSNERQAAADQVPPSMVNDPGPIRELAERLDDLTTAVAKSARFEDLHENVRAAWKLTPESYLDLKAATDTPERRDNLHAQIAAAFEPLLRDGVLGPGTLPPNEESSRRAVDSQVGRAASRSPAGAARPGGPRTDRQARRAGLPGILRGVHHAAGRPDPLRPDRRPTGSARRRLTYEAEATAQLREEARSRVPDHYDTYTRGEVLVEAGPDDRRGAAHPAAPRARRRHGRARFRRPGPARPRESSRWSRRSTSWRRSYVCRREPRFVRDPRRVAMICGLVILALALVRILVGPDLERRGRPGRHRRDDRGDRLQPELRHDGHVRPVDLDLHRAGDRDPSLPGRDGGDGGGRAHLERGPHPHQADQGRRHRGARPTSS